MVTNFDFLYSIFHMIKFMFTLYYCSICTMTYVQKNKQEYSKNKQTMKNKNNVSFT